MANFVLQDGLDCTFLELLLLKDHWSCKTLTLKLVLIEMLDLVVTIVEIPASVLHFDRLLLEIFF